MGPDSNAWIKSPFCTKKKKEKRKEKSYWENTVKVHFKVTGTEYKNVN